MDITRPGKPGSVIPDSAEGVGYRSQNCKEKYEIELGMNSILNLEREELYSSK
jgi:hypothetical protein